MYTQWSFTFPERVWEKRSWLGAKENDNAWNTNLHHGWKSWARIISSSMKNTRCQLKKKKKKKKERKKEKVQVQIAAVHESHTVPLLPRRLSVLLSCCPQVWTDKARWNRKEDNIGSRVGGVEANWEDWGSSQGPVRWSNSCPVRERD